MAKKKAEQATDDKGMVRVRAKVSFGVFVDGQPVSAGQGQVVSLPADVAAGLERLGWVEREDAG